MPSTRIIAPRPNQARRKALSFLLTSSALTASCWEAKSGFWIGARRITDALSPFPFCFFFLEVTGTELGCVGVEDPNPMPAESGFLGCGTAVEEETPSVGCVEEDSWDLIEKCVGLALWRRRYWGWYFLVIQEEDEGWRISAIFSSLLNRIKPKERNCTLLSTTLF